MHDELEKTIEDDKLCKQSAFADDIHSIGKLKAIKLWWTKMCEVGPKYGYFPKASKSLLILKDQRLFADAQELFAGTGIQISCSG